MEVARGRCLCGGLRYEFEGEPEWVAYCHCESCRRHTSSPVAAFVGVKAGQFRYLSGAPRSYQSSTGVWRHFCPTCGSPMAYTNEGAWPGEIHLYLGTLEKPETFVPTVHVHTGERLRWFEIHDTLPRYERAGNDAKPVRQGPRTV